MIEPREFILNYTWNTDDEYHSYKEHTGFTIKFDYDNDKYLVNTIDTFGDCREFAEVKTEKELIEMIEENYDLISDEFIKDFDDLLEKLKSEVQ